MAYEIIYVCNSLNNKNVRNGELKILRKHEDSKYFEFGERETNIKKRYYDNIETLNKDFKALEELKAKQEKQEKQEKDLKVNEEVKEVSKKEPKEDLKKEEKYVSLRKVNPDNKKNTL